MSSDNVVQVNISSELGYVGWIGNIADRDCVIVEILRECGANIFVRTNVPQTLIVREDYPIYALILNIFSASGAKHSTMSSDVPSILIIVFAPLEARQAVKVHY